MKPHRQPASPADESCPRTTGRSPEPGHGNRLQSYAPTVLVGSVGILSGVFAAYSYYHDSLRPFTHSLTPWVVLAALTSTRQDARTAGLRTTACLLAAVAAFYTAKPLFYGFHYPTAPDLAVNIGDLVLWCVLAAVSGPILGIAFSHIGRPNLTGAAATAGAASLAIAAGVRETGLDVAPPEIPFLVFAVCAVVTTFALSGRSLRQLRRSILLTAPLLLAGLGLVAVPDLLEQIVVVLRH